MSVVDGGFGLDFMDGGAGVDTLDVTFFNGAYHLNMVTGVTNFVGETAINFEYVHTGNGHDIITGTLGANYIDTNGGNDRVFAGSGNDRVYAGTGNDFVDGGAGNDRLLGEAGNDSLIGGTGNDYINGTSYAAEGNGERDVLTSGSLNDQDLFVLGDRSGGVGRVFYNNAGDSDLAIIRDFDRYNFVGDLADRIQLMGSAAAYSITSEQGGAGIRFGGDLIGLVEGVSAANLNLNNSNQFTYV